MTPNHPASWERADLAVALALVLLSFAVYAPALTGGFVYDDTQQIVANPLIREGGLFWRALTSDVWAFKGDASEPRSAYWRPAFVLWLVVNERLFGVESAVGWHAMNIALHAVVCVLGYRLVRRLGTPWPIAAAALVLFCVHPVQVESVAWVSGSPNILSAATLLGALLFFLDASAHPSALRWAAALGLYLVSLLSKEIAVLFPAITFAASLALGPRGPSARRERIALAARRTAPFLAVAAVFLVARFLVLGRLEMRMPWHRGPVELLVSLPSLLAFYLRQIVFPVPIGPSYPLRPIEPAEVGLSNFWLPLVVTLATLAFVGRAARRGLDGRIGAMLLLLPLLPAMNINAYIPEQIVHDRYLYLPLFGALLLALPALAAAAERLLRIAPPRAERLTVAVALALSVPLAIETVSYSKVWKSELSLWERAIEVDPESAFNLSKYGNALRRVGRLEEARAALDRSIAIHSNPVAMTDRGILALAEGRLADAERDLRAVVTQAARYAPLAAYEHLCLCLQRQGRLEEAAALLRDARERHPYARARVTANLAVLLYGIGRRQEVLAELEAIRPAARAERDPGARKVLFLLGMLYSEMGRADEARATLEEYLALTQGDGDPETQVLRKNARQALGLAGR